MNSDKAGPSSAKRRKVVMKNRRSLATEEIDAILCQSSNDEEDGDDTDDSYLPESLSDSDDSDTEGISDAEDEINNETGTLLEIISILCKLL